MDPQFKSDLKPICELLNKHGVKYMLIGGFAVNHHGYVRATGDIDIWYEPTVETYINITKALKEYSVDVSDLEKTIFDPNKCILRIPLEHFHLDLLPSIKGDFKFREAYQNSVEETLGDAKVRVISYEHLLKNKISTARPADLKDVEELKIRKGKKSG